MDVTLLVPEITLVLVAAAILLISAFQPRELGLRGVQLLAALGLFASGIMLIPQTQTVATSFSGAFVVDGFTAYFKLLLVVATSLVLLASGRFLEEVKERQTEAIALVLLATSALMLLVSATELITLYVSLEMASLSFAFLAAWNKKDERSTEAGLKFFLLNALSSAVLLYGMAVLYGITGETRLDGIARNLVAAPTPAVLLAVTLLLAGFGFKVSAVPFQMWTPDVYEGAPTPVTAYLSVASKAAGFAVAIRVFQTALPSAQPEWTTLVALLAAVTMTFGNVVAMAQTNIKRMLAYSTIAQAGYVLIGVATGTDLGVAGVLFYLAAYTATNLAAFIAVIEITGRTGSERIADFAGLHQRAPWLAFVLAVSLLSLAGLPPLAGFFAKIYIFWAALQSGLIWLVLLGVLNSALSLYYYARVIHDMYMLPGTDAAPSRAMPALVAALAVTTIGVFGLGIFSTVFIGAAEAAARTLGG